MGSTVALFSVEDAISHDFVRYSIYARTITDCNGTCNLGIIVLRHL